MTIFDELLNNMDQTGGMKQTRNAILYRGSIGFIVCGLLCVAIGVWQSSNWQLSLSNSWAADQPAALKAIPSRIDIEIVDLRGKTPVEIKVKNLTSQPLQVTGIETSCECSVPQPLRSNVIGPDQEVTIQIALTSPGFGKREALITIHTNSKATPKITVPIVMTAQTPDPPILVRAPDRIQLKGVTGNEGLETTFRVFCFEHKGAPWLIGYAANHPGVTVEQIGVVAESPAGDSAVNREYEVRLRVTGMTDASEQALILTPVTTTEPDSPAMRTHVAISIAQAIRAVPPSLLISRPSDDSEAWSRVILLTAIDEVDWQIESATSDLGWLSIETVNDSPVAKRQRLTLRGHIPRDTPMTTEGLITIATTHPQCRQVVVPVVVSGGSN